MSPLIGEVSSNTLRVITDRSFDGSYLRWGGLKTGALKVWCKPFTLYGEVGIWEFPSHLHGTVLGVGSENVSQPFLPVLMWVFSQSLNVWE